MEADDSFIGNRMHIQGSKPIANDAGQNWHRRREVSVLCQPLCCEIGLHSLKWLVAAIRSPHRRVESLSYLEVMLKRRFCRCPTNLIGLNVEFCESPKSLVAVHCLRLLIPPPMATTTVSEAPWRTFQVDPEADYIADISQLLSSPGSLIKSYQVKKVLVDSRKVVVKHHYSYAEHLKVMAC